jgi:hypothetical protein
MLEKIILPDNSEFFGGPFLPLGYDQPDCSVGRRKREKRVEMIGHQQEQIRPLQKLHLPTADRFNQVLGDHRPGELIV